MLSEIEITIALVSLILLVIGTFLNALSTLISALQMRASQKQHTESLSSARIMKAHDFIQLSETNEFYVEARASFNKIRDTNLFVQAEKRLLDAISKKPTSDSTENGGQKERNNTYQSILRHLNNLEMMAAGIKEGVFDEYTLKAWRLNGFCADIAVAQKSIEYLREKSNNHKLYSESIWLAWRWQEYCDRKGMLTIDNFYNAHSQNG